MVALTAAASELGPAASILAMIANEQLTNSVYQSAVALDFDDEVRQLLERNFADERRHLRELEKVRGREWQVEAPDAGTPS